MKNKNILTIGGLVLAVFVVGAFILAGNKDSKIDPQENVAGETINIDPNTQVLNILVRGGYSPNKLEAKANTKTILKMNTKNTYDCSSSLIISSLNFRKTLPANGTTDIEIPPQKVGSVITGSCSMGMYGFKINFI